MLINLESLVVSSPNLSYWILFGGMFIEGEVFLLLAAYFAYQGLLRWDNIILAAFFGLIIGDLVWYFLGKFIRNSRLGEYLHKKAAVYDVWLEKNFVKRYAYLAFFSKFLYYVNRIVPLLAGWHRFPILRFFQIHLLAGSLWLIVYTFLGYFFSSFFVFIGLKDALKNLEIVFIGLAVIILAIEIILKKVVAKKLIEKDTQKP